MRVLICDPVREDAAFLRASLENDGFTVDEANGEAEALGILKRGKHDAVICELKLAPGDGLSLCRSIREGTGVPVMILTRENDSRQKLLAFEYGADDYVLKPYDILELKARVKALARRGAARYAAAGEILRAGDIEVNVTRKTVELSGERVKLTAKEFDLLTALMREPGRVFSRDELFAAVWGDSAKADPRTVDVHIRRLRQKLEKDDKKPEYIL
ncbi:MAG: response regulator transcription factor, partial [Clostridia bacterium]|nr:response regulator transcription factor [Clostridia bacterium]